MQNFEALLFLFLFVQFFFANPRSKKSLISFYVSTALVDILMLVHLYVEGYRWQLIPFYILVMMYTTQTIIYRTYRRHKIEIKQTITSLRVFYLFLTFFGYFLLILFAVNFAPSITGNYSVGTKTILLTDSSREEVFTKDHSDFRSFPVRIWYPAEQGKNRKPYWVNSKEMSNAWAVSNGYNFLSFLWSHLKRVKTYSYNNAELKTDDEKYPVIIFSHDYWQSSEFNVFLMEELASHGYIVLSISHEYENAFSVYPDNSIKIFSKENEKVKKRFNENSKQEINYILNNISRMKDSTEQKKLWEKYYGLLPNWMESCKIWVDDIQFVIDEIEKFHLSEFIKVIDTSKIAVMGYSFGGGVSGLVALNNNRVKAFVNMDGYLYAHNQNKNIQVPTLFMLSEKHDDYDDFYLERAEAPFFSVSIANSRPYNFTDMAILAELGLKITGNLYDAPAKNMTWVIYKYVVGFLNYYLKDINSELLRGEPLNEDVKITKNNYKVSFLK